MNVEDMRRKIRNVYPGDRWKRRVYSMYDDQVIAIYHAFAENGRLENPIKEKHPGRRQLSIFDLIKEERPNKETI